jgi:predicted porin
MNPHMKKQALTAVALSCLCASSAMAQSSVTMYGVIDIAYAKVTGSKTQMYGSSTPNNGTSRWGMRGSEDLGGGMKASFNLESAVEPETGGANLNFARAANVTLSGGFGSVKLGRTLTPSFYGVTAWEATGAANYSVVNSQFGYGGPGSRHNAEVSYTSPSFNGLQFTLGHIVEGDNAGVAKTDLNVIYRSGPLSTALTYNKLDNAGSNVSLGAAYTLGKFSLHGSLQDATGASKGKGFTLGGKMPMGPWTFIADVARDTEKKDTDLVLEARYALSKRTMLYGVALRNGAGKAATAVNTTSFGIRHNF